MESLNIFCLFWLLIPFSTWCLFSLCDTEELSEHLTTAEVIQRIDSFIKAGLDCHNNPGLTITVVRKDEIILAKGYGYKTTEKTEPVTNLTLFGVASLSKAFAVTLILKLIEEYNGSISLQSKVADILDKDNLFFDDLRSSYTTLDDLMAHRTGVPPNNQMRYDNTLNRASLVRRLRYLKPVGDFRNSYYYSNLMYGLLTHVGEMLGGRSWEDLVKAELFAPLEMDSSSFATTALSENIDLAPGYVDRNGHLVLVPFDFNRRWGELCGSGCVLSNAVDMANWMMFLLSGGKNKHGQQILKKGSLKNAFNPQNSIESTLIRRFYMKPAVPVSLSITNYGLGWQLGHYRGYRIIRHSGSTYGYRALVTMLPDYDFGVFVAMTGDDPNVQFRTHISLYVLDLLLGDEPWLNTTTVCSSQESWKRKKSKCPKAEADNNWNIQQTLNQYIGIYTNNAYGTLSIYLNKTSLMMQYGFASFMMHRNAEKDEFCATGAGMLENIVSFSKFQFETNRSDGVITSLLVPSFEPKMPPRFIRKIVSNALSSGVNQRNWCNSLLLSLVLVLYHYHFVIPFH